MLADSFPLSFNIGVKEEIPTSRETIRKRERFFTGAMLVSMVVATGPGVLLVNRPETVLGFPIIYVWGVAWYFLIAGLAIATDRLVWSKDCDTDEAADDSSES